ncbi:MAG: ribosomal-protein-alanine N-acetyltransferase [Candidatus Zixiibacteriota bacterium]|nr:MAG: ribosomal-protein-alanine N-acetyltransferase [candidate division Zixibacteria bacterium]
MSNDSKTNEQVIVIRDMVPDDIEKVVTLEKQIFSDFWSQSAFVELLGEENCGAQVATHGSVIIGYSCFIIDDFRMHLANIAVVREHRRKSVAQRLLESILQRAKEDNCEFVSLEVRPSNMEARAFYDKHGFSLMRRQQNYYQSPVEDALVLVRFLNIKE